MHAFLNGQASWSTECVDTINFLDHVMRESPSQKYTQIKKSFFQRGQQRFDLGKGVEAFKGVFISLRPVLDDKFNKSLAVNVDVANGTFWHAQPLGAALCQMFGVQPPALIQLFKEGKKNWKESRFRKDLRPLKRVGVTTTHTKIQFTIDDIVGLDASEVKFPDPDDRREGVPDSKRNQISIYAYFKKKYNINCMPGLPVVKMTKRIRGQQIHMPIDVLTIDENQRYNTKLNDQQTTQMIKFAVTLPKERWAAVQHGVGLLNWANDPYLKHYGLQVNPNASKVKARILPPPTVHFGAGSKEATISPKDLIQGRWRLDGRKFAINNKERPIKGWGVCVIQGRGAPPQPAVEAFVQKFIQIYEGHGGVFAPHPTHGKQPWMGPGILSDGGELVANAWNKTGNRYSAPPMFMIFIVLDRNVEVYRRIKKSCDNRFGCTSQVLQSKHVISASPQYISNVCMKVNAKLGGATTIAKSTLIPKIAPKSASSKCQTFRHLLTHTDFV
jgi:eukaryotic translation initiation factor 2C